MRAARDVERRFCFEVVSPFNNLLFQAENEEILQYWMQVIQNAIANQLNNQISQKSQLGAKDNNFDSHFDLLVKLHQLYPENSFCCDCSSPRLFFLLFYFIYCFFLFIFIICLLFF